MPRYLAKKRVEKAVDDRITKIYRDLAEVKGWVACPLCEGQREILDTKNKILRCTYCKGAGYIPPRPVEEEYL